MTRVVPGDDSAVVVRAAASELIGFPPQSIRLLVDSPATAGRLSAQRVTLNNGVDGANPHHHSHSAELFFVLGGSVQLLVGDELVVAEQGDLAVVPPGLAHAFAAAPACDADLLIVITPGVERFEYFRLLARIALGEESPESLRDVQELYDTYFENSPTWHRARRTTGDQHAAER